MLSVSIGSPSVPLRHSYFSSRFRFTFSANRDQHHLKFSGNWSSGFCNSLKRVSKSGSKRDHLVKVVKCGTRDDEFYMRRCVDLASLAIGRTSPDPLVGCVIVKDGNIIGEAYHSKFGDTHAEVLALRDAGLLAENATVYINIEPCDDCTEALIKAKVKRVVVGIVHPNPIVPGERCGWLIKAKIQWTSAIKRELCTSLNEAFIHLAETGKPFVALRYTLSLNGHFSHRLGHGVEEPGGYYSQLLQKYDAVIFSCACSEYFSNVPTSLEPGASQPLRIIVASDPNFPVTLPPLTEETASKTVIFTDRETVADPETAKNGVETVALNQMNLNAILDYCKLRGCCSVLLDARRISDKFQGLLREGIEQDILQKVVVEILPEWHKSDNGKHSPVLNSIGKRAHVNNLQPKIIHWGVVVLEGYVSV